MLSESHEESRNAGDWLLGSEDCGGDLHFLWLRDCLSSPFSLERLSWVEIEFSLSWVEIEFSFAGDVQSLLGKSISSMSPACLASSILLW